MGDYSSARLQRAECKGREHPRSCSIFGWSVFYKNIAGMLAQEDKQEKWEGLYPLQSVSLAVLFRECYIAYLLVHSRASLLYFSRSALYV